MTGRLEQLIRELLKQMEMSVTFLTAVRECQHRDIHPEEYDSLWDILARNMAHQRSLLEGILAELKRSGPNHTHHKS